MRPDVLARAFGTDLPLSRTSRTASALNSFVNARRFRLAMTHSYRTFVRSEVSTKPAQVHIPQHDARVDDKPGHRARTRASHKSHRRSAWAGRAGLGSIEFVADATCRGLSECVTDLDVGAGADVPRRFSGRSPANAPRAVGS